MPPLLLENKTADHTGETSIETLQLIKSRSPQQWRSKLDSINEKGWADSCRPFIVRSVKKSEFICSTSAWLFDLSLTGMKNKRKVNDFSALSSGSVPMSHQESQPFLLSMRGLTHPVKTEQHLRHVFADMGNTGTVHLCYMAMRGLWKYTIPRREWFSEIKNREGKLEGVKCFPDLPWMLFDVAHSLSSCPSFLLYCCLLLKMKLPRVKKICSWDTGTPTFFFLRCRQRYIEHRTEIGPLWDLGP